MWCKVKELQQYLPLAVLKRAKSSMGVLCRHLRQLQQYLPLAVLKLIRERVYDAITINGMLQQYLPLAVLKPTTTTLLFSLILTVATVLTACGIETNSSRQSIN